jgi:hypothetical protein
MAPWVRLQAPQAADFIPVGSGRVSGVIVPSDFI